MQNDLISRSALLRGVDKNIAHMREISGADKLLNSAVNLVQNTRDFIAQQPAVDAVEREKLIKKLFPMGVPKTREEWNYSINAKAVYEAIMKTEG